MASPPPCPGCATAEPQIRALLDHIAVAFSKDPSGLLGFDFPKSESDPVSFSRLFRRWIKKFDSDPEFPLCPDLKKRIKALVRRLVGERAGTGSAAVSGRSREVKKRRRTRSVEEEGWMEVLEVLRCVGADPCDEVMGADREWREKVLEMRKLLFLRMADVSDAQEFPYPKKQRTQKFLCSPNGDSGSSHMSNNHRRRSQRTLLKFCNSEIPRKRIPVGSFFQADVPEIINPPSDKDVLDHNDDLDDSRWLGNQLWPIDGYSNRIDDKKIGKGIPSSCECSSPGSVECVRSHVDSARRHLKSDLGPAFFTLGFGEMGEEVSNLWTQEEQMKFDDFVRQNPISEGKSFLEPALRYFMSKSRQDIVSFYFNVFVLRWMSMRTRLGTWPVYSSDDDNVGWE